MKQPKLNDLKLDKKGTRSTRKSMVKSSKTRITIYFDDKLLAKAKKLATQKNVGYQSLLNTLLNEALEKSSLEESRLDKLEKEIKKLKKLVAA